jgi:hypothetical protein
MGGVDAVNLGINTIDVAYSVGDFFDRFLYLLLRNISWSHCCYWTYRSSLADGASLPNFRALLGGSMLGIIYR